MILLAQETKTMNVHLGQAHAKMQKVLKPTCLNVNYKIIDCNTFDIRRRKNTGN